MIPGKNIDVDFPDYPGARTGICKRLTDKVAIITGASRGLGKAMAFELAKEGASVAGCCTYGGSGPGTAAGNHSRNG